LTIDFFRKFELEGRSAESRETVTAQVHQQAEIILEIS